MSTLNEFIAAIKTEGLAKTNRYIAKIGIPGLLNGQFHSTTLRKLEFYCEATQLPGMSISTQQSRMFGEFREMPYERLFDNITLTFLVDNTLDTKAFFDTWINSIQDPAKRTFNYYNDYISDIDIEVLDTDDSPRYVVTLFECYPKSISSIQLDYNSKDIMKLQVSINYRYWMSGQVDDAGEAGPTENGPENLDEEFGPIDDQININDVDNLQVVDDDIQEE